MRLKKWPSFLTVSFKRINHLLYLVRNITFIALTILSTKLFSQDNGLIKLAFADKSNFEITTFLDNRKPVVYYVLNKTRKWETHRFHLEEDLTSDSVRTKLENDEHSYYNHTYVFKDAFLDSLFDKAERQHLYKRAKSIGSRTLTDTFKVFSLIKSFGAAKNGFFFSVTDPVFTRDKQYAFIDIIAYKKDEEAEDLNAAAFGITLLVYKYTKEKGWSRIRKRDHLIL